MCYRQKFENGRTDQGFVTDTCLSEAEGECVRNNTNFEERTALSATSLGEDVTLELYDQTERWKIPG